MSMSLQLSCEKGTHTKISHLILDDRNHGYDDNKTWSSQIVKTEGHELSTAPVPLTFVQID